MSLRRRLALLSALAVAFAVLLASGLVYTLVRDRLRGDVDNDLHQQAERVTQRFQEGPLTSGAPPGGTPLGGGVTNVPYGPALGAGVAGGGPVTSGPEASTGKAARPKAPSGVDNRQNKGRVERSEQLRLVVPPPDPGGPSALAQLISSQGAVVTQPGSPIQIPVSSSDRALAAGGGQAQFADAEAGGTSLRVLTEPLGNGMAIQVARSLEDTNHTLNTLIIILAAVSAGGIALAAALGPFVARTALAPAGEVSDAAEEVARTHDLTHRIEVRGNDELGRLAASFNEMMAALEISEAAQRRLVADASHELRTPLATLRTNIETLGRTEDLDPAERKRLVADLTQELEEMTELVGDVVELARAPGQDAIARRDVALDELTRDAI
jgi:two-component system sensor histidine kinase MprB